MAECTHEDKKNKHPVILLGKQQDPWFPGQREFNSDVAVLVL